ncbi:protein PHYTOCHROME KINASE SUBSTRATE 1-like [Hibiscus syriacus]|uniref:protein PHYTOCHROME KINASE SUBSTRATE 1-like n=1 Tax=Hibiscus syriacus TaxID=106335 RepID=UPI00192502F6|nr:protein PHYTOCHROME KINASE SUBSTRATE 1-like [Hibiscus syriacus]
MAKMEKLECSELKNIFNGAIDVDAGGPITTKKDSNKLESTKHHVMKPLAHQAAPSMRSESSWNSQNPLLDNIVIQKPRPKPSKPVNAKSFFTSLAACNCNCFDRNSIDIDVSEISFKRPNGELLFQRKQNKTTAAIKEDPFTFRTMDSTVAIRPIKVPSQGDVDEIGRKSLEEKLRITIILKVIVSDASSDLFKIESLTGKPNHCYAPSGASIEWSVVTASAAEYDERRPPTSLSSPIKTFPTATDSKTKINVQRPRSSGLLGCNSSKAVKIDGDAHKTNQKAGLDPRMRHVSDSYMPVTRLGADSKLVDAGAFERRLILATRSLPVPPSHSPSQASPLLYIQ